MAGASKGTLRVKNVNANWTASRDGTDGEFALMVVTEDDTRHTVVPSTAAVAGLLTMIRCSPVLLWDLENSTLIGTNIVGEWLPLDWSGQNKRVNP